MTRRQRVEVGTETSPEAEVNISRLTLKSDPSPLRGYRGRAALLKGIYGLYRETSMWYPTSESDLESLEISQVDDFDWLVQLRYYIEELLGTSYTKAIQKRPKLTCLPSQFALLLMS